MAGPNSAINSKYWVHRSKQRSYRISVLRNDENDKTEIEFLLCSQIKNRGPSHADNARLNLMKLYLHEIDLSHFNRVTSDNGNIIRNG